MVLKSLFGQVTQLSSSEAPKVTWQVLNEVYQAHKTSDHRRKIYRRIGADFQQKRQIPGRDEEGFRRLLLQSLGFDPLPPPDPRGAASSPPSSGVATSSPLAGVALPPTRSTGGPPQSTRNLPQSTGIPPQSTGEPAPPLRSNSLQVWSRRLICCSTSP